MDEVIGLKIAEAINNDFGPPFLKENFVKATYKGGGIMRLVIGRRDADINMNTGETEGAGTSCSDCGFDETDATL